MVDDKKKLFSFRYVLTIAVLVPIKVCWLFCCCTGVVYTYKSDLEGALKGIFIGRGVLMKPSKPDLV